MFSLHVTVINKIVNDVNLKKYGKYSKILHLFRLFIFQPYNIPKCNVTVTVITITVSGCFSLVCLTLAMRSDGY